MDTKRTWKLCDNEAIVKLFNEVSAEAERLYPATFEGCKPELFIDGSTKHLGMCKTEYTHRYYKSDLQRAANTNSIRYRRGVILLSKYILHDMDKVTDVLCHELGHYVSPAENHGYLWKARANKIGAKWGVTNERLDKSNVLSDGMEMAGIHKAEPKYTIECPKCHAQWKYKRMCKIVENPARYQCTKCKEKLIRVK